MVAWHRQRSREVLQNLSWLSACKQSGKPRANQVNPITKWPMARFGHRPAELLFGRKMRTKLPELREESIESEMRDRDGEMKAKAKQYADKKRNAQESDLAPGDKKQVINTICS